MVSGGTQSYAVRAARVRVSVRSQKTSIQSHFRGHVPWHMTPHKASSPGPTLLKTLFTSRKTSHRRSTVTFDTKSLLVLRLLHEAATPAPTGHLGPEVGSQTPATSSSWAAKGRCVVDCSVAWSTCRKKLKIGYRRSIIDSLMEVGPESLQQLLFEHTHSHHAVLRNLAQVKLFLKIPQHPTRPSCSNTEQLQSHVIPLSHDGSPGSDLSRDAPSCSDRETQLDPKNLETLIPATLLRASISMNSASPCCGTCCGTGSGQ